MSCQELEQKRRSLMNMWVHVHDDAARDALSQQLADTLQAEKEGGCFAPVQITAPGHSLKANVDVSTSIDPARVILVASTR
jgi:hypothetical protein